MNSILKKVNNLKMFKNNKTYEDDAAPSRPRKEPNRPNQARQPSQPNQPSPSDRVSSSSSSSDEEDIRQEENIRANNNEEDKTNDDKQNFDKSKQFNKSSGGNTYSQNITIHVAHSSGTHIGHQYFLNLNNNKPGGGGNSKKSSENEESHEIHKPSAPPPEIERVFSCREEAQNQHFIAIKYDVRGGCRKVAEKLGLDQVIIEKTYNKYKDKGISEVFFQLMIVWKQCQPRSTTTVGMLCEALWNSNETIAAKVLAKTLGTN